MKVGAIGQSEWMDKAKEKGLSFGEYLFSYVVEDFLLRVGTLAYKDNIWMNLGDVFPESAEQTADKRAEKRIQLFYKEEKKNYPAGKIMPGCPLDEMLIKHFCVLVLLPENDQQIVWNVDKIMEEEGKESTLLIQFTAKYREWQVPLWVEVRGITDDFRRPVKKNQTFWILEGKSMEYLAYSYENQIGNDLFEIVNKLELIGDMAPYYRVYKTAVSQSLSGRYLYEELDFFAGTTPQVKKEKRMEQLRGYRSYAYMKKRFCQYLKRNKLEALEWEDVLDCILALLEPLWVKLCHGEVFFDDWMPEIRRNM